MITSHAEALAVWTFLLRHAPDPVAGFLMPNHFHWLHRRDVFDELRLAMSAYTRHCNHRRGTSGRLWVPLDEPSIVARRWSDPGGA